MLEPSAEPGLHAFCRAMLRHFFTAMSGPLSVPLAVAALWVENQTAKIILGLTALACVWAAAYWIWKPEREKVITLEKFANERNQQKQQLLDEIAELRTEMVRLRIEMEQDLGPRCISSTEWQRRFDDLQARIAAKIEQFSTKAEAQAYSNRGNINRPPNPMMGGFLNPLHLDLCIHDLDYLREFIQDYSRHKNRVP
jgi:hypothetical protein